MTAMVSSEREPEAASENLADAAKAAREAAGLTQPVAARALGLSINSLSRKELGKQAINQRDLVAMERVYGVPIGNSALSTERVHEAPVFVAREESLPGSLERTARDFEREAVRLGATDDEADYIHYALHNSSEARRFYMGDDSKPLSAAEQEEELRYQIEGLRVWVTRRIAKRAAAERKKK